MKLKEAPKQVKIEVTQTDINRGDQGNAEACAIARAIKRTMGDHPIVDDGFTVEVGKKQHYYTFPQKAQAFIERFDEDKKLVKPFSFVAKRVGEGEPMEYEDK